MVKLRKTCVECERSKYCDKNSRQCVVNSSSSGASLVQLDSTSDSPECLELTFSQEDLLKELGNIGTGNATVALSRLMNKRVDISLTSVEIMPFWKIKESFSFCRCKKDFKCKNIVFGIFSNVEGEPSISIYMVLLKNPVLELIELLGLEQNLDFESIQNTQDLTDSLKDTVSEIGNIIFGHYISSLANMLNTTMIPEVPMVALDYACTLTDGIIANFTQDIDYILIIDTKLKVEGTDLDGNLYFIPRLGTLEAIFNLLKNEGES
ncbi:MAG: chemotaxis protein CheC [Candidatus Hodarchaeota archaeon]